MSGAATRQPIDLEHLAQYTGGDADINAEVLVMFVRQYGQALIRLSGLIEARDAQTWREVLHTLKGSALGVGAFPLAEEIAATEAIDPEFSACQAVAALESLRSGYDIVSKFVATHRRG